MALPTLLHLDPNAHAAGSAAALTAAALCAEAPRLRRLVHRLLGWRAQPLDLDDLVQDVLLRAWQRRAGFRGDAALATWLLTITLTTVHNHVRARQRRQRWFGWLDRSPEPRATTPGPSEAAMQSEHLDATAQAMQRLEHGDREVLVLRYLEQRDVAQIAAVLALSRAAVDARLSRARRRLRTELGLDACGREERP